MFELGRLDFMSLYSIRKAKFMVNLCVSTNSTLRLIYSFYINSTECQCFLCKNELHAVARSRGGGRFAPPPHLPPGQLLGFVINRREIFFAGGRGTPVSCFILFEIVTV
jgi:hypothetical protein